MSEIDCKLILEYEDEETANMIADSLDPDNGDYIDLEVVDNKIMCRTEGSSSMHLLHTIDDFLSCLSVAENTLEKSE